MPRTSRKKPRTRSARTDGQSRFDETAAERAVQFIEHLCRHSTGEWAGRPFILEPWQRELVRTIFGWRRKDGTRRYRVVFVSMGRKNGKSTLAAAIAAILLFADDEPGAQVFSAAADRDQARIVFGETQNMVRNSPELAARAEVLRSSIYAPVTGSVYRVLSADAGTKHGLNPHGVLFDELHAQRTRELYDVLVTGTAARRQPLVFIITTAGFDRKSICYEVYQHACAVRDKAIRDESFLPVIYELDAGDDWRDEAVWPKANPNLEISVKRDYLRQEAEKAKSNPAAQNTFRRLHLNQWTEQVVRSIDMNAWALGAAPLNAAELSGRPCWAGIDLSSKTDVSALVLLFPMVDGSFHLLPFFWIPEDNMAARIRRDRVPFDAWVRDGFVEATPGNVIDYAYIRRRVKELRQHHDIREIAFDPWNATQLATWLGEEDGMTVLDFAQQYSRMNEPTQNFLALIPAGRIRHGGNPVLTWMAGNLATKVNSDGMIRPAKDKSADRIDGIVAAVMALGRAMSGESGSSVYETRGLVEMG